MPSFLKVSKSIEKRMWDFETPLRQHPYVKPDILTKLEARNFTIDKLRELDVKELGHMIHHGREFRIIFPLNHLRFTSHQSNKKSWAILQNFNFEMIKLTKTPKCHLPNVPVQNLRSMGYISCSSILPPLVSRILFRCLFFNCYNISIC